MHLAWLKISSLDLGIQYAFTVITRYSRVRNKYRRTFINFWTFLSGVMSFLKGATFNIYSILKYIDLTKIKIKFLNFVSLV